MVIFGKLAEKINKKLQDSEEEITFKSDEEEILAEKTEYQPQPQPQNSTTLKADESEKDSSIKFKLVKPQGFEDVSKIADFLIEGCTVVLNTENLDLPVCRRMLDFLNGVTYTTDGYINAVAQNTYIITPHDVDVSDEEE